MDEPILDENGEELKTEVSERTSIFLSCLQSHYLDPECHFYIDGSNLNKRGNSFATRAEAEEDMISAVVDAASPDVKAECGVLGITAQPDYQNTKDKSDTKII